MLSRYGNLVALEMDDRAREMANVKSKNLLDVKAGSYPNETPFPLAPINKLFESLFGFERFLLKRFDLPFGVSLISILRP